MDYKDKVRVTNSKLPSYGKEFIVMSNINDEFVKVSPFGFFQITDLELLPRKQKEKTSRSKREEFLETRYNKKKKKKNWKETVEDMLFGRF
jgi:hypothetical protein